MSDSFFTFLLSQPSLLYLCVSPRSLRDNLFITYHLSPITYRLSPIAIHPTTKAISRRPAADSQVPRRRLGGR